MSNGNRHSGSIKHLSVPLVHLTKVTLLLDLRGGGGREGRGAAVSVSWVVTSEDAVWEPQ